MISSWVRLSGAPFSFSLENPQSSGIRGSGNLSPSLSVRWLPIVLPKA